MVKNKILLSLTIMLMILSVQGYAVSGNSDVIEVKRVINYAGKWHIRYNDVAQAANLTNEEVFVDGVSDRVVNAGAYGTDLERGYSLNGNYSTDACHEVYITLYDKENDVVTQSNTFKFGNLSKCEPTVEEGTFAIKRIVNYAGKWYIRYHDVAVSETLDQEELFIDGVSDRIVNAGAYGTSLERGYPLHGSYDKNSCHEAYLLVYDYNHHTVNQSAKFMFGDTTQCGTEVLNAPPTANAGADQRVTGLVAVNLVGQGTDSDGVISSYEWKEGGDVLSTEASFTYTPTTFNEHILTLTVTDDDGATATDTVKVTVDEEVIENAKVISGTVTNSDGAVVSNAQIKFEYLLSGQEKSIVVDSDAQGHYSLHVDKAVFDETAEVSYILSSSKSGYIPDSASLKIGAGDEYTLDFILNPIVVSSLALEENPEVHHLGDDSYAGTANSQFQKSTEGISWSVDFNISSDQYTNYNKAFLKFQAKGIQLLTPITLNINAQKVYVGNSPSDGSYGDYRVELKKLAYREGANTLTITSSRSFDYDDFEFVNMIIEFQQDLEE